MNEMHFDHNSEVFSTMWKNFDLMIERTIGNMVMRDADESVITLKIGVSLDRKRVPEANGFRDLIQPSFKHDLNSVMQVKDKMSGTFKGNVELIFDKDGKPIIRDIDDGQMNIFDNDGLVSVDDEDNDADLRALPAAKPALPESKALEGEYTEMPGVPVEIGNPVRAFEWLMGFRNTLMHVNDENGVLTVRAAKENQLILSSGVSHDNPFYVKREVLEKHIDHDLICVTSPEGVDSDPDAIEIWCDDCGDYIFGIQNPNRSEDDATVNDEADDYGYEEPEA